MSVHRYYRGNWIFFCIPFCRYHMMACTFSEIPHSQFFWNEIPQIFYPFKHLINSVGILFYRQARTKLLNSSPILLCYSIYVTEIKLWNCQSCIGCSFILDERVGDIIRLLLEDTWSDRAKLFEFCPKSLFVNLGERKIYIFIDVGNVNFGVSFVFNVSVRSRGLHIY